jgi:TIR domain
LRVFLSYATEQRLIAEEIAVKLRSGGHRIFFDKHSLHPSDSYDWMIQVEIDRCHLFVFLVSAQSVEPGTYALTEVKLAEARWPNPSGRVMPVLVSATNESAIPPFLRSVTILEPAGNVAADVAAEVDRLAKRRRGRGRRGVVFGLVAACGLSALAWLGGSRPDSAPVVFGVDARPAVDQPDVPTLACAGTWSGEFNDEVWSLNIDSEVRAGKSCGHVRHGMPSAPGVESFLSDCRVVDGQTMMFAAQGGEVSALMKCEKPAVVIQWQERDRVRKGFELLNAAPLPPGPHPCLGNWQSGQTDSGKYRLEIQTPESADGKCGTLWHDKREVTLERCRPRGMRMTFKRGNHADPPGFVTYLDCDGSTAKLRSISEPGILFRREL